VYAQADAEPMGALPMTLRIVPDALSLLMPEALG
jgi:diacylglycerol kinase family enzyme